MRRTARTSTEVEDECQRKYEVCRDGRDWGRAGRVVGRLSPEKTRAAVRDSGCEQAGRRCVAKPVGFVAIVHTGAIRRVARANVSRARGCVPDEGGDGSLSGGLCRVVWLAGAVRDAGPEAFA